LTLGSLFDGIGGFPLAATRNGINPMWASEKEAAPISITKRHFPSMKHLGDIKKINGAEIEPVDIITFGSPCQDLSMAGKREGLKGERSGLFMEAVRIIKEMREKTDGRSPARIIWENVVGAFSSNEGEDFRIVLEEISSIGAGKTISIPRPSREDGNAIWESAGAIMGDGWSLAWRVLDAQYWGVPQRRKRIFLVADFRGERAGEILFEPESLPRNIEESGAEGKGIAGDVEKGFGEAIPINTQIATRHNALGERTGLGIGKNGDPAFTLQEAHSHAVMVLNDQGGSSINVEKMEISPTLKGQAKGHEPLVFEPGAVSRLGNHSYKDGKTGTLRADMGDNQFAIALENHPNDSRIKIKEADDVASAIKSRDYKDSTDIINNNYLLRRLTPLECERLQGFPDGWTEYGHNGNKISDSQRYKTLGNSLAIPCVEFIFSRIKGKP